jgi:outer membrane protein TolC
MKQITLSFLICCSIWASAQDTIFLDERVLLKTVWYNSPIIKAQKLNSSLAQNELLQAKSNFEPKLRAIYNKKDFDSTLYYSHLASGLDIQTPFGLKLSAGYQNNDGVYLNPELNVPQNGLRYTSVEVPLGAGLLTDKYRTYIKLARYNMSSTDIMVQLDINKLLYEAGKAYWKWYESAYLVELATESVGITKDRFNFVRAKYAIGEYAAIDTLEAYINYQNRQNFYNEQLISYKQRKQQLLAFMGFNQDKLITPIVNLKVQYTQADSLWLSDMLESHPMLQVYKLSILTNEAKKKLSREFFKPKIDLKYSMLTDASSSFLAGSMNNNYVGMKFSFPLFLRSERALSNRMTIENEILDFERQQFEIDLDNQLRANVQMRITLDSNQQLMSLASSNYQLLLQAEQKRFQIGESNNFLLNRREIQWLTARKSFVKSYTEFRIQQLRHLYLMAFLPELVNSD